MSGPLSNILVVADMDGTLLSSNHELLPCNLETIRLFKELGGNFTVATGRMFSSVGMYSDLAPLIAPAITCGGGVIYDFEKDAAAKSTVLPHVAARQALRDVINAFPEIGILVVGDDMRIYQVALSDSLQSLIKIENMNYFFRPEEDLPDFWDKVTFAGPPELIPAVEEYLAHRTYPGIYFVRSGPTYLEMMPEGVSKGTALHDLCELMGIPIRRTYVIGDYFNDMEMMNQAGYAVAVENAPQEVKDIADEVVASNDDGGVGRFLYSLIQEYAP